MSDVKWIKITTDIFDDEKVLLIESLPEADSIIVIWFKLLCLAGKMNNSGVFMLNDNLAYTDKMLSTIFRRKEATVKLALETFERFGMVQIVNDVITIPNWGKHQNLDKIEKKTEYQRTYMRNYREKQKLITSGANSKTNSKSNCKTNSNTNVSSLDKDIEKDIDIKREREEERDISDAFNQIVDLYNTICKSLPEVKARTSISLMNMVNDRLEQYSLKDFETLFEKAEASTFLTGKNKRGWLARFDWLIENENMANVLNGKYDNSTPAPAEKQKSKAEQEFDDMQDMLVEWVNERTAEQEATGT